MTTRAPRRAPVSLRARRIRGRVTITAAASALAVALTGCVDHSSPAHSFDSGSSAATGQAHARALPAVHPVPQHMRAAGPPVALTGAVTLVTGEHPDAPSVALVRRIVRHAGGTVRVAHRLPRTGTAIAIGTATGNPAVADTLRRLSVRTAAGLDADGYVLATGHRGDRSTVVLNGVDHRGSFYAAQTLRQLVRHGQVPGVRIRDWPLMPIRGTIEGFYGIPWSHRARLDQMAFYGRHKLNTYVYTPKDDPLLRAEWRTPYSGAALRRMKTLVKAAGDNHVDFTFALSPGNDICYSSDTDLSATEAKFDQLRTLGVRSFYIALDDIPRGFHCAADKRAYAGDNNDRNLARAQADYLNRLEEDYIRPHGLPPLQTVPTHYSGSTTDAYKSEFGTRLDDDIRVQWTGEGVFSATITDRSVQRASASYRTDHLYLWDNYPVNDAERGRLFLAPLTGRSPDLYRHVDGITANPMIEPYASMPALAGVADYTWNGPAYDPAAAMSAALTELAGPSPRVQAALRTFADLNHRWPHRPGSRKAPQLSADVAAFWAARRSHTTSGTRALSARLAEIARLPTLLRRMAQSGFEHDARAWINAASLWAKALQHQIRMLRAIDRNDRPAATRQHHAAQRAVAKARRPTVPDQRPDGSTAQDAIVPRVGDGVFAAFTAKADKAYREAFPVR